MEMEVRECVLDGCGECDPLERFQEVTNLFRFREESDNLQLPKCRRVKYLQPVTVMVS